MLPQNNIEAEHIAEIVYMWIGVSVTLVVPFCTDQPRFYRELR